MTQKPANEASGAPAPIGHANRRARRFTTIINCTGTVAIATVPADRDAPHGREEPRRSGRVALGAGEMA